MIKVDKDRLEGIIKGVVLADTLAAPFEFRGHNLKVYSKKIAFPIRRHTQFQGRLEWPVGAWTDDSEMTMLTMQNIIESKGKYNQDLAIDQYTKWANSGTKMMGKHTRALFCGIKTRKGYDNRAKKLYTPDQVEKYQSNGALMRCSILSLFDEDTIQADCSISNPSTVAIETNLVYSRILKGLIKLKHTQNTEIKELIKSQKSESTEVQNVIDDVVMGGSYRNISNQKGWCLHALWIALYTIWNLELFDSYSEAIEFVVWNNPGSDTDTTAAITGGLLGAIYGWVGISKTEKDNWERILKSEYQRPDEYHPKNVDKWVSQLLN